MSSSLPTATAASSATPWIERYRPQSLDDISHQSEIVATLRNAVNTNRLPHLLFYGPPGTGKTSVALALCRTLWHPSYWSQRVLELNASDERGIAVVRDKIKQFASLAVGDSTATGLSSKDGNSGMMKSFFRKTATASEEKSNNPLEDTATQKYPNPPFKIIILDEADTVTPDAQAALRRIIEAYSKITRFILICNYVTRIIEPLASRCAKFRFQSLPPASMKDRLLEIAQKENCRFSSLTQDGDEGMSHTDPDTHHVLDEILTLSRGDMRRAIQTLQSAHSLAGHGGVILKESVSEMMGLPPSQVIDSLISLMRNPELHFDDMVRMCRENILLQGHSAKYIIASILERITNMTSNELGDLKKAGIAARIAEMDKLLVDGADETLQLVSLCSYIQQSFKA